MGAAMTTALDARPQCGTEWGYRLHRVNDEPYCDSCRAACTAAAARRRRDSGIPRRHAARCGTQAGYARHLRTSTKPCAGCRAAKAAYMRAWRANRRWVANRGPISTRSRIRDILETWAGDWFTYNDLVLAITAYDSVSETAVRRAIHRLVASSPDWLETSLVDGERHLRAPDRSYLWM